MNKKIFLMFLVLLVFITSLSANIYANSQMDELKKYKSNETGWIIQPPLLNDSNFLISVKNNWKVRTCEGVGSNYNVRFAIFFTDHVLSSSEELKIDKHIWKNYLKQSLNPRDISTSPALYPSDEDINGVHYSFVIYPSKINFSESLVFTENLSTLFNLYNTGLIGNNGEGLYAYVYFADYCKEKPFMFDFWPKHRSYNMSYDHISKASYKINTNEVTGIISPSTENLLASSPFSVELSSSIVEPNKIKFETTLKPNTTLTMFPKEVPLSNYVGWKIRPPIIDENLIVRVSFLNGWADRKCIDLQGIKALIRFSYEEIDSSDLNDIEVSVGTPTQEFELGDKNRYEILTNDGYHINGWNEFIFYTDININKFDRWHISNDLKDQYLLDNILDSSNNHKTLYANIYLVDRCSPNGISFNISAVPLFKTRSERVASASYSIPLENIRNLAANSPSKNKALSIDNNKPTNINIYYTLNELNLESFFENKIIEFGNDREGLRKYLSNNVFTIELKNREALIKKYFSPVELSSGEILSAIAIDMNSLTLSNPLTDLSISRNKGNGRGYFTKKFSLNFSENIINKNMVCEKDSKICYYDNWSDVSIFVEKTFSNKPVYFSINELTPDYKQNVSKKNPGVLSSNKINLGVGNYVSNGRINFVVKNNSYKDYFIAAGQDGSNIDYLFFIRAPGYSMILEYKSLQRIINKTYCVAPSCLAPDWMPYMDFDLAVETNLCEQILNENGSISEFCNIDNLSSSHLNLDLSKCPYSEKYQILCHFNIFNLNGEIGSSVISSSSGSYNLKDTYFQEIKSIYDVKTEGFSNDLAAYKLFESERKNFGLSNNEIAIFFSIIGAESSFKNNKISGNGDSIGLTQVSKKAWRSVEGFNNLKPYLPANITTYAAYQSFFDASVRDLNKSLYLGLAVFKYNLSYSKKNILWFSSSYTDIEKAFIMFYAHQSNIFNTTDFFNTLNPSATNNEIIINCVGKEANMLQNVNKKRLGCIATLGSIRKLGWYLYYYDNFFSALEEEVYYDNLPNLEEEEDYDY